MLEVILVASDFAIDIGDIGMGMEICGGRKKRRLRRNDLHP